MEVHPLRVDLHSHLIPGIDDGAQSEHDSLVLINGLYRLGYRKCITTPHVYKGVYNNDRNTIGKGLQRLKDLCSEQRLDFTVEAAAEYFFDNHFFELVEKKDLLTFGGKYVLFELPMRTPATMVEEIIIQVKAYGYQPVLAHPERYTYYHDKKLTAYQLLKQTGVLFQLNLMSLTGHYNEPVRRTARDLIDAGMIEFAGSDIHREKHLGVLQAVQRDPYYIKLLTSGKILNNTL